MKFNSLEKSILRTIVFFDLLNYPLTSTEVWRWLYRPAVPTQERTLGKVADALEHSEALSNHIGRVEGFYHLKGRESIVPERKRRNNRVDHQMRKTVRMTKLLRCVPWVRMIAAYSSLAIGNVKETSDIDLLIVARKNTIWLTRFFTVGILKILRKRPDARTTQDRFCLSFFITDDALNVERGAFGADDIGYQYYMLILLPIYDPDKLLPKFRRANPWLAQTFPNSPEADTFTFPVARPVWLLALHRSIDIITWPFFNGIFSDWYCNMQLRILPEKLKSIANIDSRVIISDTMLKFHDKDTRHELRKKWLEKCASYE
ncbi:MAG: hypothetical protein HY422_00735 [Candidatus Komeilibacteria bacterium]|nr:hypothetical protein [Candidatus Komeilibacteria bacterium]